MTINLTISGSSFRRMTICLITRFFLNWIENNLSKFEIHNSQGKVSK